MEKNMSSDFMSQIPIDHYYADDTDSSGDETASIIAVASTVDSFRYENGRRYHAFRDGSYWGANDDINAAFEKVVHHLFLRSMGDKLHLAPVQHPGRIADLGTGTGLWVMDMADQYEDAEVLGIDLSPVPPPTQPNVQFEVDDVTSDWTHTNSFNLIHIRSLYGSIEDWPLLYKQCLDHLEPSGYIEQVEFSLIPYYSDGSVARDSIFYRWVDLGEEFDRITRKPLFVAESMKGEIEKAGFVEVVERRVQFPLGAWSSDEEYKAIGKWFKQTWITGMEGWILASCTRYLHWSTEDVRKFLQETKKALEDRSNRIYFYGYIVYGKKP